MVSKNLFKDTGLFKQWIKDKVDKTVKNIAKHYPNVSTVDISEGIPPQTFIKEYLHDKVHIKMQSLKKPSRKLH